MARTRTVIEGVSQRTRICTACGEPASNCRKLAEVLKRLGSAVKADDDQFICGACESRLESRIKSIKLQRTRRRQDSADVREAFKNSRGDQRRGAEEVYYGPEFD